MADRIHCGRLAAVSAAMLAMTMAGGPGCADPPAPPPLAVGQAPLLWVSPRVPVDGPLEPPSPCVGSRCDVVVELAAADELACALFGSGQIACWGGGSGEPRAVPGIGSAIAVAAGGDHACAVRSGGGVACWSAAPEAVARGVPGFEDAVALAVGGSEVCVATGTGRVRCATLAHPSADRRDAGDPLRGGPIREVENTGVATQLAAGGGRTCALDRSGDVACWREGASHAERWELTGVHAVALGDQHQCALLRDGRVLCWGSNEWGMVGAGEAEPVERPTELPELGGALALAAGAQHTCALLPGTELRCWGRNERGQVDPAAQAFDDYLAERRPVAVTGLTSAHDAIGLAAGRGFSCALRARGGVTCWGSNRQGQLGDGTVEHRDAPVRVRGLARAGRRR